MTSNPTAPPDLRPPGFDADLDAAAALVVGAQAAVEVQLRLLADISGALDAAWIAAEGSFEVPGWQGDAAAAHTERARANARTLREGAEVIGETRVHLLSAWQELDALREAVLVMAPAELCGFLDAIGLDSNQQPEPLTAWGAR